MASHLFFICPTDYIEGEIRKYFRGDKMFITSLGNSVEIDEELIIEISEMVEANEISAISFILADDNTLFQEFKTKNRLALDGLKKLGQIIQKKTYSKSKVFQPESAHTRSILSFLEDKSSKLQVQTNGLDPQKMKINSLVFNRSFNAFIEAHSSLFEVFPQRLN